MFEGKSLWQIFSLGGFTMYILLFCSVLSMAVIFERLFSYYKKSLINKFGLMKIIKSEIEKDDITKAIKYCETNYAPVSAVVLAGLKMKGHDEKAIISSMDREIMVETVKLEQYTSIVGTIGNIAVYIGLFGTVLGIIRSFHDISSLGSGHISIVIGGVSESLICTATGLLVAIPAVVAYNYFIKRIDNFITDMEYCASQTADLLVTRKNNDSAN